MKSLLAVAAALLAIAAPCVAQVTPSAGYTPPDDTPAIRVGVTIFADYTVQQQPKITGAGGSLNGSYTFRLKYAYAQWNLDDHLAKGSYARFGMQPNPYFDFFEAVYRYRFQGTTFTEREGYQASSEVGAVFRYPLPQNYGDVQTGFFNGE